MELAATRLIAMRKNKGKSIAACLHDHTSYIQNPDKTEQGELVSSYQCSPLTVDEEFMLTKRLYEQTTGRRQKSDVIAYQVRQSFRPGEVTPEEANRIGYEFAERFLKGKHAFIVATHTDRAHIHNHIIYNSTALDGTRKFRDFFFSALAVQRLSDLICLEHQLSVIQKKPYRERQKRILYPPKESNRDKLCAVIDNILLHDRPKDFAAFLDSLEQQGYEVKRGKHPSVKGKGQRRFIRFRTLGAGYTEEEIRAVLDGKAEHQPHPKQPLPEKKFGLLMDIPAKMAEGKTSGYKKWATKFNLKEMSKTLLYLQEKKIDSADELRERAAAATERYHTLGDSIKAAEKRMGEIAVLRAHIVNYAKTRDVYAAYRKAGYSKKFLEAHREEIELHKAAKAAFDEADLKKLPKVKDLNVEYSELLSQKKAAYPEYRKAKEEMQELVRAQKKSRRTKQNRCVNAGLPELTIVSVPGSLFLSYNPYGDALFLSIVYTRNGNRYSKECKQLDRMRLLYERIIWTAITGTAFETSFDVGASSRKSRPFCQLYRDGGARTKGTGACNHCQNLECPEYFSRRTFMRSGSKCISCDR